MPRPGGARATVILLAFAGDSDKSFEKTMKKTSWRTIGIPSWFIEAYGDECHMQLGLSYSGRDLLWNVHISVSEINGKHHVAFGRGWKEFAHFHQLQEGEQVKFTLVKPSHFVFPIHCQQVFFSDDEDELGWKVVLRTEVRGRRIDTEVDDEEDPYMFAMERDVDFEGLQALAEVPEANQNSVPGGRDIPVNEVLNDIIHENNMLFDRDLGESSEDGD